MSNEQEAFEAWLADPAQPFFGDEETREAMRDGWSAALAWAATQQAPVAFNLEGTNCVEFDRCDYHDGPEWTPLYAHPAPAECAAPAGYVLVPAEPTAEMLKDGADLQGHQVYRQAECRAIYIDMIAAAPKPQGEA